MANQKALIRLMRLRHLQEELSRAELEAAVAGRDAVEREMSWAVGRQRQGRLSFVEGMEDEDLAGRTAGLIQMESGRRQRQAIEPRRLEAETEVERQRSEFLARRGARRQVETLVENAKAELAAEAGRRAQQMLDDWYGRQTARGRYPGNGKK